MIAKQYIANNRNKETQTCKVCVETPWDGTNMSSVLTALDLALPDELKGVPNVNTYQPISYNPETQIFVLEVEIDVQDIDFEDEE